MEMAYIYLAWNEESEQNHQALDSQTAPGKTQIEDDHAFTNPSVEETEGCNNSKALDQDIDLAAQLPGYFYF